MSGADADFACSLVTQPFLTAKLCRDSWSKLIVVFLYLHFSILNVSTGSKSCDVTFVLLNTVARGLMVICRICFSLVLQLQAKSVFGTQDKLGASSDSDRYALFSILKMVLLQTMLQNDLSAGLAV